MDSNRSHHTIALLGGCIVAPLEAALERVVNCVLLGLFRTVYYVSAAAVGAVESI